MEPPLRRGFRRFPTGTPVDVHTVGATAADSLAAMSRTVRTTAVALITAIAFLSACGSEETGADVGSDRNATAAEFATEICRVTKDFDVEHAELNESLGNAQPGSEDYRRQVIAYLEGMRELVGAYAEVNERIRIDGKDAAGFQTHFGDEMEATAERAQRYVDALETAEAPVVDLAEVVDDIAMRVNYAAWRTGQDVRAELQNCDLG